MGLIKVTLCGLLAYNQNLFDPDPTARTGLVLPTEEEIAAYTGQATVENTQLLDILASREDIIDVIIERDGDFPLLYADPDFLASAMYSWSRSNIYKWASLAASCLAVYNPVENYDRRSEITREGSSESGGTAVHSETAFNTGEYSGKSKDESAGTTADNESVLEYVHGNIGIRSAQELIAQQREIAAFNYFDVIADDFKRRWCIDIY